MKLGYEMPDNGIRNTVTTGVVRMDTNQFVEVEDVTNAIHFLNPEDTTFWFLSTQGEGKLAVTGNRRFHWPEYEEPVQSIAIGGNIDGAITPDSSSPGAIIKLRPGTMVYGLVPDMMLRDVTNDNRYRCVRVINDSRESPTIVLTKLIKTSNAKNDFFDNETTPVSADFNADSDLRFLYVQKPAGTNEAFSTNRLLDTAWNTVTTLEYYTEIDTHKLSESWLVESDQRQWQVEQMQRQAGKDVERILLFGSGYDGFQKSGKHIGNDLQASKGFMNFMGIPRFSGDSMTTNDIDWLKWLAWMQIVSKYNKDASKTGWVNDNFIMMMHRMIYRDPNLQIQMDFNGREDKYGMNVKTLVTPFGNVNCRVNQALNEQYPHEAVCLTAKMDKIRVRYLAGNGHSFALALYKDVQDKKANFRQDKVHGGVGLECANQEMHSIFKVKMGSGN